VTTLQNEVRTAPLPRPSSITCALSSLLSNKDKLKSDSPESRTICLPLDAKAIDDTILWFPKCDPMLHPRGKIVSSQEPGTILFPSSEKAIDFTMSMWHARSGRIGHLSLHLKGKLCGPSFPPKVSNDTTSLWPLRGNQATRCTQMRTILSFGQDTICVPSGEKAMDDTTVSSMTIDSE
jgi:hypothetical protein